ncbi:MAG: response regulator, partial [Prevotellaceae bacterium]|nr:response regulator [Prevotellaceae bacterium]
MRFLPVKCSLLLVLLASAATALASDILRIEAITDRNGLSQNTVRCMVQDSKGFMWMGTTNGLNRYNGKEFSVMQAQISSLHSLQDNRIRSIQEDEEGYIWVRTVSSVLYCYDSHLESFIDYDPGNASKKFSHVQIAKNGDVWMWGTDDGCCRVKHEEGGLKSWHINEKLLGTSAVNFLFEDAAQRIWICTNTGLFRAADEKMEKVLDGAFYSVQELDKYLLFFGSNQADVYDKQTQEFIEPVEYPQPLSAVRAHTFELGVVLLAARQGMYVFSVNKMQVEPADYLFQNTRLPNADFITDNKGSSWIYNMSGRLWRQMANGKFESIEVIPSKILSSIDMERYEVYQDSRNIIWITTYGNGLFALYPNGQMQHYTAEKGGLPSDYLLCITEDTSGEVWVGTEFAGVAKISLTTYATNFFYPASNEAGNRANAVRLIYQDAAKRYWLGTRSGHLYVCDSTLKKIHTHKISGALPYAMAEDRHGNKWVGTKGKGVFVFSGAGAGAPRNYTLKNRDRQLSSSNNIFSIMRDNKGRMWVASFGGGLHLAEEHQGELSFRQITARTPGQNMVRALIQDRSGVMWAASNEGVNAFNPDEVIADENLYINFSFDTRNDSSLNNNEVKALLEDSKGRIWLGTNGGGLNLLVREQPLERSWFRRYSATNGLSNEVIQAMLEDEKGNIWVSTENGISRFDPDTEKFENYTFSDKHQANLFNEMSCWRRNNGALMFGSFDGVCIFDPMAIAHNSYVPQVVLTELRVNGSRIRPGEKGAPLKESITTTRSLKLKYEQNTFDVEFAMLNFHEPEFNQYMYYLEGYEKTWNEATRYNVAPYRNVPAGKYKFHVKGSNSFGIWNDDVTTLDITVVPPFWRTWWAMLIYLFCLSVIFYFAWNLFLKIHRLNTAVEVEKQLTEYKLRFFTNISHEFRTPLTIIRGAIENLAGQRKLPMVVAKQVAILSKSSTRLLRLIDQLLEFRRLQNDKMELRVEPTNAVEFFQDIFQTFKELAEKKKIEFLFEASEAERQMLLDRGKMDKICYNLLSNAFKNTPEGGKVAVRLLFSEANDRFTLSVSDSGVGIPKEKRELLFKRFAQIHYVSGGVGVGLHLTSELAMVHKGSVDYSDSEYGGACFSVHIPLSDKNYESENVEVAASLRKVAEEQEFSVLLSAPKEEGDERQHDYKLLLVDDDDEVREFLQGQLGEHFAIAVAKNGVVGLEKAQCEAPDLVVCDVMMPEMDGFEVTRRLKDGFETSHIPIILLTAHSSDKH